MDNFIPYQQNDWFENYPGQTNIPTETNELPDWESMFYAPEFPDPQSTLSAPEYQQLQMEFLATIPPLSPQQTGTNAPQPMGQDIVAPNTFQQGDVFHTVPMGQIATSTNVALPVPAQTGTNWRVEPSPPLTPPRRVVRNPRGYRRSVKSCERCTIHKLKCDDNLNGCQRCATVGEECWEKDPHIRGRMLRAEANSLVDRNTALLTWCKLLEDRCKALGVGLPGIPAELAELVNRR